MVAFSPATAITGNPAFPPGGMPAFDGGADVREFTFTVDSTLAGSASGTFIMPTHSGGSYNCDVYIDDVFSFTATTYNDANWTMTGLGSSNEIKIVGEFTGINFNNAGDKAKIQNISRWGEMRLGNTGSYFYGCSNLTITATDVLDMTGTTLMNSAFRACSSITTIPSVNSWDMSAVTTTAAMFLSCVSFNQALSFNSTNVTAMNSMFQSATSFNSAVTIATGSLQNASSMFNSATSFTNGGVALNTSGSIWDVSNVTNMSSMFRGSAYNSTLTGWNTVKVTNMANMFRDVTEFNQDISHFDTALVTDMSSMFSGCSAFNNGGVSMATSVNLWNVSAVTTMAGMFQNAAAFNQNINNWDTSSVTAMNTMFGGGVGATAFNQDITGWDVSAVTIIAGMFQNATSFNQAIGVWTTTALTRAESAFDGATSFDQDLSNWDFEAITTPNSMELFLDGVTLSTSNYTALLVSMSGQTLNTGLSFDGGNSKYIDGPGTVARADLTGTDSMTITDGGVEATALGYWDASDTSNITDTGTMTWADLTSNGYDFIQATAGKKPSSGTRTINSLNTLDFDGTTDSMNTTISFDASGTDALTIFMAMQNDRASKADGAFDFWLELNSDYSAVTTGFYTGVGRFDSNNRDGMTTIVLGDVGTNGISSNSYPIVPMVYNTTMDKGAAAADECKIYVNGILKDNDSTLTQNNNTNNFGNHTLYLAARNNASRWSDAAFGEIIIYNTALTTAQRAAVDDYLAKKWGT